MRIPFGRKRLTVQALCAGNLAGGSAVGAFAGKTAGRLVCVRVVSAGAPCEQALEGWSMLVSRFSSARAASSVRSGSEAGTSLAILNANMIIPAIPIMLPMASLYWL